MTGNYGNTQYYVTFAQTGVGTDYTASDVMTVGGVGYDRSGHSEWYNSGATVNFSYNSPLVVTPNVKRYAWTSTSGLATTQTGTYSSLPTTLTLSGTNQTSFYLKDSTTNTTPQTLTLSQSGYGTGSEKRRNVSGGDQEILPQVRGEIY